jgi:hypothetical protein
MLEFKTFLAATGYPTGKNTRAGMGKILYPRVYMGNPTSRIFFDGYEYGMVLPDGYVPVAIPSATGQCLVHQGDQLRTCHLRVFGNATPL